MGRCRYCFQSATPASVYHNDSGAVSTHGLDYPALHWDHVCLQRETHGRLCRTMFSEDAGDLHLEY